VSKPDRTTTHEHRLADGRLVGLRSRFRFKSYDINHLPRKQSPHGGAWGMLREWRRRRIRWRPRGHVYDTVASACSVPPLKLAWRQNPAHESNPVINERYLDISPTSYCARCPTTQGKRWGQSAPGAFFA